MVTIDPRTTVVGAGPGGRGGVFILALVVAGLGLAVSGWIAAFELSRRAADEDYACVEDERGVCPPVEATVVAAPDPADD